MDDTDKRILSCIILVVLGFAIMIFGAVVFVTLANSINNLIMFLLENHSKVVMVVKCLALTLAVIIVASDCEYSFREFLKSKKTKMAIHQYCRSFCYILGLDIIKGGEL